MTERARLIDALALAARPHEREYAVHDTTLQGFMLRVQPNGARSWVFRFRRDGTPRRVTLGKPDAVKADQVSRRRARLPCAREGCRESRAPSRFRRDACEVRRQMRRAALAVVDAVLGEDDLDLPEQHYSARARSSARRFRSSRPHCPLLPRVRTQKAERRESKS